MWFEKNHCQMIKALQMDAKYWSGSVVIKWRKNLFSSLRCPDDTSVGSLSSQSSTASPVQRNVRTYTQFHHNLVSPPPGKQTQAFNTSSYDLRDSERLTF